MLVSPIVPHITIVKLTVVYTLVMRGNGSVFLYTFFCQLATDKRYWQFFVKENFHFGGSK